MNISLIVAYNNINRAIGFKNQLLYHIPDDLKRFKNLTTGKSIIMGRTTFDSIGKPLPNRENIILSRNENQFKIIKEKYSDIIIAYDIPSSIKASSNYDIFVIGGDSIYKQFIESELINTYYLTVFLGNFKSKTIPKAVIGYDDSGYYLDDIDVSIIGCSEHNIYEEQKIQADSFFSKLNLEDFDCIELENKYIDNFHYINITFQRKDVI